MIDGHREDDRSGETLGGHAWNRLEQAARRTLTPACLEALDAPIEEAHALPNAAYHDPDFLELENARLFARHWMLAGFGGALPDIGDIAPMAVAGVPIILVRGEDGVVRGFQNVCPHRGSRLVAEPCRGRKTISCPYHAWAFDTRGELRFRPHFYGPRQHQTIEDGSGPNLVPVRTESWHDLVFVNISGDAPPLNEFLAPLEKRLEGYDLSALAYAGSRSFDVAANWKLAIENYIEPYHVFAVHPRLTKFAPMDIRQPSTFEDGCFQNEYFVPHLEEGRGAGLPHWPGLREEWRNRGLWFHLFPSLSVELYADQFTVFHVVPLEAGRTREELHFYLIGDAANSDAHAVAREQVIQTWEDLNSEDLGVLERLQQGRLAPGYQGGSFSPYWDQAPLEFSRLIARALSHP